MTGRSAMITVVSEDSAAGSAHGSWFVRARGVAYCFFVPNCALGPAVNGVARCDSHSAQRHTANAGHSSQRARTLPMPVTAGGAVHSKLPTPVEAGGNAWLRATPRRVDGAGIRRGQARKRACGADSAVFSDAVSLSHFLSS